MSAGAKPSPGQSTRRRWLLAAAIIATAITIVARPGRDLSSNAVPPMAQFGTAPLATPAIPPTPSTFGRTATFDRLDVSGLRPVNDSAAIAAIESGSAFAGQGYAPPGRSSVVWSNQVGSITNGGLVAQYCCAGAFSTALANKPVSYGNHYWELTLQAAPGETFPDTYTSPGVAVASGSSVAGGFFRTRTGSSGGLSDPNMLLTIGFAQGKKYRSGDTFMFALDADNRIVYQGVNGTWTNGTPGGAGGSALGRAQDSFVPIARISASSRKPLGDSWVANFGGSNFRYPIPTGYGAYGTYSRPPAKGSSAGTSNATSSGGTRGDTYVTAEVLVGGRKLPLPEGRWLELARFEKIAGPLGDEAVILAKVNGPAVSSIIAIRAGDSRTSYGKHRSCDRQDLPHTDVKRNEENGQQQCWWVNHSGDGWLAEPALAAAVTAAGLRRLSVPQTMLNVGIRHADSGGQSLTLIYFDPGDRSVSTIAGNWGTSPWHSQNVARDQARKDYVDWLVDWGRNWAPVVYAYR